MTQFLKFWSYFFRTYLNVCIFVAFCITNLPIWHMNNLYASFMTKINVILVVLISKILKIHLPLYVLPNKKSDRPKYTLPGFSKLLVIFFFCLTMYPCTTAERGIERDIEKERLILNSFQEVDASDNFQKIRTSKTFLKITQALGRL